MRRREQTLIPNGRNVLLVRISAVDVHSRPDRSERFGGAETGVDASTDLVVVAFPTEPGLDPVVTPQIGLDHAGVVVDVVGEPAAEAKRRGTRYREIDVDRVVAEAQN